MANRMRQAKLKNEVRDFWNEQPCGTGEALGTKYSKEYFAEIENQRYATQPEIFAFAQFTRFHGQKILEVGTGAGADFIQWLRAGVQGYGLDLTQESIKHVERWMDLSGLHAEEIRVGDCEALPYAADTFDLVYSWGVIHHTPDTQKALEEIVRVCRPGGICKIMIYNRHSVVAFVQWVVFALMTGRFWKSISWCLFNYTESIGTKAYTRSEAREMLSKLPVEDVKINTILTYYDRLEHTKKYPLIKMIANFFIRILGGDRFGWFMTLNFKKKNKLLSVNSP